MANESSLMKRMAMAVLCSSFLETALAESGFFSLFDPGELAHLSGTGLTSIALCNSAFFAVLEPARAGQPADMLPAS